MKHLLMDPAFPDLVAGWAAEDARTELETLCCANDNRTAPDDACDALLTQLARLQVAATRLW